MVEQWSVVRTGEIPPLQVSDQWLVGLGPLLVVSGQIPHCALTNSGPWSTTGGQRSVEKFPRAGSDQWVVGVLRPPAHRWCSSLVGRDSGTRGLLEGWNANGQRSDSPLYTDQWVVLVRQGSSSDSIRVVIWTSDV